MTDNAQFMRGAITAILTAADRKGMRAQFLDGLSPEDRAEVLRAEEYTVTVREEERRWREAAG